MTRARWREYVRAELIAAGVEIEVLPSGLARISTQHDFVTTTDLALIRERDLYNILHRSF
jgi:hypothetical protein